MRPTDLAAVLADCVAPRRGAAAEPQVERLRSLSPSDWNRLLELADGQQLGPLLWWRLKTRGFESAVPAAVRTRLRRRAQSAAMQNLAVYASLGRMLPRLETAGIPVIVLKGAVLASELYRDICLRPMLDIDLLVPAEALAAAGRIFEEDGYRPLQRYTVEAVLESRRHLPRHIKRGAPSYEIHWNLLPPGRAWAVEIDGFWRRARPVRLAGAETQSLDPTDHLLYLCAHAAYGHQFAKGLRAACDIAETIRRDPEELDWQVFVERAGRLGWRRGVGAILALAAEQVGAEVPVEVLDRLQPEGFDAAVLRDAREQMLMDGESYRALRPSMSPLRGAARSIAGMRGLCSELLSPRAVAQRYLLPPGSARVYLYYPHRVLTLLLRHASTALRLWRREPETTRLMERRARLDDWLAGPGG